MPPKPALTRCDRAAKLAQTDNVAAASFAVGTAMAVQLLAAHAIYHADARTAFAAEFLAAVAAFDEAFAVIQAEADFKSCIAASTRFVRVSASLLLVWH